MDELTLFLVALQALGTIVGVIFAMRGEFAYVKAMHDGHIDQAERRHLDHLASGLWYGMTLVVAASLGLVAVAYRTGAPVQPAETSIYWSFMALVILVTLATWAISREKLSFTLGSAAVFTGWWFLAYLALGRLPAFTMGATAALYLVATVVFWGLLHYLRALMASLSAHHEGSAAV